MFAGGKQTDMQPEWRAPGNIIRVVIRGKVSLTKRMVRNSATPKPGNDITMTAVTDVIKHIRAL